mgnify:CR=1 FL=1
MERHKPATRHLTRDEIELWRAVTATVTPRLPRAPILAAEHKAPRREPLVDAGGVLTSPARSREPVVRQVGSIDRRQRRDLTKGKLQIDAKLDLHGKRAAEAHHAVLDFLHRMHKDGGRIVLIVTGKGERSGDRGDLEFGILRRQAPIWLSDPRLRHIVAAFGEAAQPHGGAGALYVRLRRSR